MIIKSDNISQAEFVRKILERDVRNIYKAQQLIVAQRIYLSGKDLKAKKRKKGLNRQSGKLENSLTHPDYYLRAEGEEFTVAALYPVYIRFLDMRRLGNWKVYRYPVWGILFNNTWRTIAYEYGNEIRDYVGDALNAAFPSTKQR